MLPFYIIHQTVILLVGRYVIPLDMLILLKYLVIVLVSFAATMLLCEIARRWSVPRFLFGLKKKRR